MSLQHVLVQIKQVCMAANRHVHFTFGEKLQLYLTYRLSPLLNSGQADNDDDGATTDDSYLREEEVNRILENLIDQLFDYTQYCNDQAENLLHRLGIVVGGLYPPKLDKNLAREYISIMTRWVTVLNAILLIYYEFGFTREEDIIRYIESIRIHSELARRAIGDTNYRITEDALQALPNFKKNEMQYYLAASNSTCDQCVICCGEYIEHENLRILPCEHVFHSDCVDRWVRIKGKCPFCVQDVITRTGAATMAL